MKQSSFLSIRIVNGSLFLLPCFLIPRLELPALVEEVGGDDFAGGGGVGGLVDVDDRPVRQLGVLQRVRAIVRFAEGQAGVQDDVALSPARELTWIDQNRDLPIAVERL